MRVIVLYMAIIMFSISCCGFAYEHNIKVLALDRAFLDLNLKAVIHNTVRPNSKDVLFISIGEDDICVVEKWSFPDYDWLWGTYACVENTLYDYIDSSICLISPYSKHSFYIRIPFRKKKVTFQSKGIIKDWEYPTYMFRHTKKGWLFIGKRQETRW